MYESRSEASSASKPFPRSRIATTSSFSETIATSGVGISIGLTRLFWQLQEAGLVEAADSTVDALVTLIDDDGLDHALSLSQRLRAAGLNVETQLEPRKLGKQLQYADRAGIRFVIIRGGDEAARGVVAVKDLRRGEQFELAEDELASALRVEREQLRIPGAPGADGEDA